MGAEPRRRSRRNSNASEVGWCVTGGVTWGLTMLFPHFFGSETVFDMKKAGEGVKYIGTIMLVVVKHANTAVDRSVELCNLSVLIHFTLHYTKTEIASTYAYYYDSH